MRCSICDHAMVWGNAFSNSCIWVASHSIPSHSEPEPSFWSYTQRSSFHHLHAMPSTRASRIQRRRSHHRRRPRTPNSESDDDLSMISFVHAAGERSFLGIYSRFRAVDIKYFKQIFYGTFRPEHLSEIGRNHVHRSTNNDTQDINSTQWGSTTMPP